MPTDECSRPSTTVSAPNTTSRRAFVSAAGAGATLGLAGCLGGDEDDTIKVGFVFATSGPYSLLGESHINGFQLRIDEELGGELDGREVEYVQRDTGGDPETGVTIAEEFIQSEDVDFLVGPVSGAVAFAMEPIVGQYEDEVVWLSTNSANNDLSYARGEYQTRNMFLGYQAWQLAAATGEWVYDNLGETAALSYADYAAGIEYTEDFQDGYEEAGGEVLGDVAMPLGEDDYSPYLSTIEDTDAEVVWSFFAGADAVNYIRDFHEFGLDEEMTQAGAAFLLSADTLEAQGEAAEGKYSSSIYTLDYESETNDEFKSSYESAYDTDPNIYAVLSYDGAQMMETAVEETGGVNPPELIEAMEGMELDSPRGPFEMDPDLHVPVHDVHMREVQMDDDGEPYNEVVDTIESVRPPW
ncbi:ABC transporter substrate-binding protein [Natrarchaeobius oligotrophus]|uniref:ABC transporter substrate-binding protein n=1 Tax=Natrarchaeobius chitinivorans TaxID=1679083 RepID=A0A3N6NJY9_NATCH|nr:ABC transporter substrate-binding protein [Natrarchaeobius chitinivorans]RQG99472.1 ABC transporter substrate-binding protein [Natrarchaeobius chitinivorans]